MSFFKKFINLKNNLTMTRLCSGKPGPQQHGCMACTLTLTCWHSTQNLCAMPVYDRYTTDRRGLTGEQ